MSNFKIVLYVINTGHHCSKIHNHPKCCFFLLQCRNINIPYETIKKNLVNTWNNDYYHGDLSRWTKYLLELTTLDAAGVIHVLHPASMSHLSRASTANCRLSSDSDSSCTSSSKRRCGSVDTTSCLTQTTWSVSSDPVSTSPASSESSPSALRAAGILLRD